LITCEYSSPIKSFSTQHCKNNVSAWQVRNSRAIRAAAAASLGCLAEENVWVQLQSRERREGDMEVVVVEEK
jgi:hypothetical protein